MEYSVPVATREADCFGRKKIKEKRYSGVILYARLRIIGIAMTQVL